MFQALKTFVTKPKQRLDDVLEKLTPPANEPTAMRAAFLADSTRNQEEAKWSERHVKS